MKAFFDEGQGLTTAFIWNNTSKIGKTSRGGVGDKIREIEKDYFNVIEQEVQILTPDIIIFTSGSRDAHIKYSFTEGNVQFQHPKLIFEDSKLNPEIKNIISKVIFHKYPDIVSLRVGHPNRRTIKKEIILEVLKDYWKSKHR